MNKKRGQVTIFIIIAILIVAGILVAMWLLGRSDVDAPGEMSPTEFVQSCARGVVEDSVEKILANGGEVVPTQSIMYQGEAYNYLCYQGDYYFGCYNIHPMLEEQVEAEIDRDTRDEVLRCFGRLEEDYISKGYNFDGGNGSYSLDLLPGEVRLNLKMDVEISRDGTAQSFRDFDTRVSSPIYDLVRVAREIVNSESQFCHFEYNGYMLLYPKFNIQRWDYVDSKLYRVIDRATGDEFKFAVRSCAYPPGI